MQAATFEIVSLYGENRGRDPGRPSVPDFGRRLYHLNAFPNTAGHVRLSAILRKQLAWRKVGFPDLSPDRWEAAYDAFRHRICGIRFTQCVVDYDGTVCDHSDRFVGVKPAVAKSLIGLLDAGFNLGVATGRGKSVREALRSALPKRVWNLVTVGFYNGAVVLPLRSDDDLRNQDQSARLLEVANVIRLADIPGIKLTVRPLQVTLELQDATSADSLWRLTSSLLAKHQIF